MEPGEAQQLANDLIGSAHVLVAAILSMKNAALKEVAGKRLSFSQLKILKLIDLVGPQQVGEVAAFLNISDAAASKTLDHLVRHKYLRRSVRQQDRRRSELSLTAASRKVLAEYDGHRDRALGLALADFDKNDVRRTTSLLERLTGAIVNGSIKHDEVCLQCGIYMRRCLMREGARANCQYQKRRKSEVESGRRAKIPVLP